MQLYRLHSTAKHRTARHSHLALCFTARVGRYTCLLQHVHFTKEWSCDGQICHLKTIMQLFAGCRSQNKSMEGLSARTVIINACCQVVIFLYILNNETSMLIIGSVGALCLLCFCHFSMKATANMRVHAHSNESATMEA